jgi:hypothetical protein
MGPRPHFDGVIPSGDKSISIIGRAAVGPMAFDAPREKYLPENTISLAVVE